MANLRLEITGEVGSISVRAFLSVMQNSLKMLADLDSALSGDPKGSLDWVITDLAVGSAVIEIESQSRTDDRNVGPEVVENFVRGLAQIEREGTTPPYLSDAGMISARNLLKIIGSNGASGLIVSHRNERTELSARASANIDQLLPARYRSIGSIEGRLEMISIHGSPRFIVYLERTRKAVRCKFKSEQLLEMVKEALGRRVSVSGVVHSNARGEPLSVDVEQIRLLRTKGELPTTGDLGGSDPDFTEEMGTEEYIRSIRAG